MWTAPRASDANLSLINAAQLYPKGEMYMACVSDVHVTWTPYDNCGVLVPSILGNRWILFFCLSNFIILVYAI